MLPVLALAQIMTTVKAKRYKEPLID